MTVRRIICFLFHRSVRYYFTTGWQCGRCGEFWETDNSAPPPSNDDDITTAA